MPEFGVKLARKGEWSPFRAYSGGVRNRYPDICVGILLLLAAFWFWHSAHNLPAYQWQWGLLGDFLLRRTDTGEWRPGLLLLGLGGTLRLGMAILAFSLLLGGCMGLVSARKSAASVWPITAFITLARNTPPLVILFCVYFFAGNILPVSTLEDGIRNCPEWLREIFAICIAGPGELDRMLAAVLALGSYQAAFVAEIVRGSVESINRGQWEAARSLGFGYIATLRLIILPQAIRVMMPPLTGQAIYTFKDSALASLISLPELTFESLEIMAITNMTLELWLTTGVLYLLVGLVCAALGRWLEYRFSRWQNWGKLNIKYQPIQNTPPGSAKFSHPSKGEAYGRHSGKSSSNSA